MKFITSLHKTIRYVIDNLSGKHVPEKIDPSWRSTNHRAVLKSKLGYAVEKKNPQRSIERNPTRHLKKFVRQLLFTNPPTTLSQVKQKPGDVFFCRWPPLFRIENSRLSTGIQNTQKQTREQLDRQSFSGALNFKQTKYRGSSVCILHCFFRKLDSFVSLYIKQGRGWHLMPLKRSSYNASRAIFRLCLRLRKGGLHPGFNPVGKVTLRGGWNTMAVTRRVFLQSGQGATFQCACLSRSFDLPSTDLIFLSPTQYT